MLPTTFPLDPFTLALYSMTGGGKSTQAALLGKWIHEITGKQTLYCLSDLGNAPAEMDALLAAKVAKLVDLRGLPHPYLGAGRLASGMLPEYDGKTNTKGVAQGKWVPFDFTDYGLWILDSGTSYAQAMFNDLSEKAGAGVNIGGDGAMNFRDSDETESWGTVMIGSSNKSHYNVVQTQMHQFINRLAQMAQRLRVIVLMTFTEDRGESESTKVTFIGPKTMGTAQTAGLPGLFKFCWRLVERPAASGQEGKHELWTARHQEGGLQALANRRYPVGGFDAAKHPICIEPANVVLALQRYIDVVGAGAKKA